MKFDYGSDGLDISLNPAWNVTIFNPNKQKVIKNPIKAIRNSIKHPIGSQSLLNIIKQKKDLNKICIVASDSTRPVPSHFILTGLVDELNSYGIKDSQIFILIATGLHRPTRVDELERILGKDLKKRIEVVDHIATDKTSLVDLGYSSNGVPIFINKNYSESDLKIVTGYVEPHFFFGFSGGRKSIVPGIAGEKSIQGIHSAKMIASSNSRFGIYEENPMHKNSNEIVRLVGADFTINVCINEEHKIVKIAAGNIEKVHKSLVNYQLKNVFKEIKEPFDIVICGNGGYPLDINLYQAVKSMALGEMAVKENGTIISVNECSDGIGIGQDKFRELIYSNSSPQEIYKKILNKELIVPDQWEIQILTRILMKVDIFVVSKLKEEEIGNIGLKYAKTVEEAINSALGKHGKNARILLLPNGPQVLPLLKK